MWRVITRLGALGATLIAVGGVGACGVGSSMPNGTVVKVGGTTITEATLNHWMTAIMGGDYFQRVSRVAPRGLVAEPLDLPACISASESLVSRAVGAAVPTKAALSHRCEQLHESIKQQALSFLISSIWRAEEAALQGIAVTDSELTRALLQQFPTSSSLEDFLNERRWVASDELYEIKNSLLTAKLIAKLQPKTLAAGYRALTHLVKENTAKLTSKTDCRPGYVVPRCRQYKPGATPSAPAPALLIEELAAG